ncbi:hypothetical protein CONPUDRAFT_153246 [Coniophora puteana RWD-64-598 SS2]|uniref:Mid2 domain-containing protein n=1 Tax=Coniophora puteana (strain RWD-64-598) TaxID=741705 RepID=A0A5M3MUS9_CONPW|nr:uncharacterized protein CONPUDRAFT_153246 [Coniophora puteana RWD-64-598 SS2]EIW82361.1 hypothetical protein CONPUDRAFT_153246 [Coniophora puteana RWD-64-598 SS2]
MHHRSFTTFVYTTFLITLSLSSQVNAENHRSLWSHRRRADSFAALQAVNPSGINLSGLALSPSSTVASSPSSTSPPQFPASSAAASSVSLPASSSSQQQQQSTPSPPPQQFTPSSSSPPASSAPSSSQQSTASPSASTQSQASPFPINSSPSQASPSVSSPASGSTAPQSSVAAVSQGNQGAQGSNTQAANGAPSGGIVSSSPTSTNSSGSNKSFFDNKGLVAGTFSAAGILAIACLIGCGMCWARRRSSRRDFDDDQLFFDEKKRPFSPQITRNSSPEHEPEDESMEYPRPAYGPGRAQSAHMYPPQAYARQPPMQHMHMNVDVGDGLAYYGQPVYAPQQYGIGFPPNAQLANPYDGPTSPATPDSLVPAALRPSVKHQSSVSSGLAL